MSLPEWNADGRMSPGIHAASFAEVAARFGTGSNVRRGLLILLRELVAAAGSYPTLKRILLWGSFVTDKPEPGDLDYSVVVAYTHSKTQIAAEHRRFFIPADARQFYGTDTNYLLIPDYPLASYSDRMELLLQGRDRRPCGIVEISLRGEEKHQP